MKKFDSTLKKSATIGEFKSFDVVAEWNEFSSIVNKTDTIDIELESINLNFQKENHQQIIYMLGLAASMILIFSVLFLFKKPEISTKELITTTKSENIKLIDGTLITLGKNSVFQYYTNLNLQNLRSVNLKGEAIFEVSRNILPFKVYYEDVFVEVLGTKFSIETSGEVIVIKNISGSVKVVEIKNLNNYRILSPGDIFQYKNGNFINPNDIIMEDDSKKPIIKSQKEDLPKKIDEITPVKGSRFTLESVIKNYLIKFNKKKIKMDKKSKPDLNVIVTIDNINKPYLSILEDLRKQGLIDFVAGDCPDCFVIKAPQKK